MAAVFSSKCQLNTMTDQKSWAHQTVKKNNKQSVYIVLLLLSFLALTSCLSYRNMRPTGEYTKISESQVRESDGFRIVSSPQPNHPVLELQVGSIPVIKEKRRVKLSGEKQTNYVLAGLALTVGGAALAITGWDEFKLTKGESGDTTKFYTKRFVGILAGIGGLYWMVTESSKPWKPAFKNEIRDTLVYNMDEIQPFPNAKVRAYAPLLNEEWTLQADNNGRISFDIGEVAFEPSADSTFAIHFELLGDRGEQFTYNVLPNFLAGLKQHNEFEYQLQNLSDQIRRSLTETRKTKIAVLDFQDLQGETTTFGKYLSEELITRLFKTRSFDVIERRLLNKIMNEHQLAKSGVLDINSAKKLGRILGVDAIVVGTITDLGNTFKVNSRLISTERGEVFAVAAAEFVKDNNITTLIRD